MITQSELLTAILGKVNSLNNGHRKNSASVPKAYTTILRWSLRCVSYVGNARLELILSKIASALSTKIYKRTRAVYSERFWSRVFTALSH